MKLGKWTVVTAALALSGCVAQDHNDARKMIVNGKTLWFGSGVAVGSCTEVVTAWLFDEEAKILDRASGSGPNLPCAMLTGSVGAAAIGAGVYAAGSDEIDNTNQQQQEQSQSQAQSQSQKQGYHRGPKYWPHHDERDGHSKDHGKRR